MAQLYKKKKLMYQSSYILRRPQNFAKCGASQIYDGYFAKMCGLLRIYVLYFKEIKKNKYLCCHLCLCANN